MVSLVAQMVKNLPAIWETQVQPLGWEDPLEKGMTTHSSILACRTPWTEEPCGLQSMGSQRVRRDWATNTHTHNWIQHELDCLQRLPIDFAEQKTKTNKQKSFVNFWGWVCYLSVCWGWDALNTETSEKRNRPEFNSCLRLSFLYSKLWVFCFTTGILRKL